MTNWSDEQLERLVNVDNHKMVKDVAGETRWVHSLSQGKWNTHSIKVFEDEKTAYSWLYFWIPKWDSELRGQSILSNYCIFIRSWSYCPGT